MEIAFHRILTEIYHVVSRKHLGNNNSNDATVKTGEAIVITSDGTPSKPKSSCCK